ncbi:hypothetical protein EV175_000005 [Coemansia sp. RSA 1933]|nr:hypothetical protein EV175_000005 [Coemansia sp. RSA 1933]
MDRKRSDNKAADMAKGQGMEILSESEFTSQVGQIIERDFFPDLQHLRAQSKELGLTEQDDAVGDNSTQDGTAHGTKGMTLGQYLSTHTSEDNASFGRLVETENTRRRHMYGRMVGDDSSGKLVALTGTADERDARKEGLETWKYTARNALMFEPPACGSRQRQEEGGGSSRGARILAHNTRLPDEDRNAVDEHSDWDAASVMSDTISSATPVINGYKMIRDHGAGGRKTRAFVIGETTPRERLALRLSTPKGAQKRASRSGGDSAGGSTAQRAAMLSPAAQRLLRGAGGREEVPSPGAAQRNDDQELRRAYNSPYARRGPPTRRRR